MVKISIVINAVPVLAHMRRFVEDEDQWKHGKPIPDSPNLIVNKLTLLQAAHFGTEIYCGELESVLAAENIALKRAASMERNRLFSDVCAELGKTIRMQEKNPFWCFSWIGTINSFNGAPTTTHKDILELIDATALRLLS